MNLTYISAVIGLPTFVRVLVLVGVVTVTLIIGAIAGVFLCFLASEWWEPPPC